MDFTSSINVINSHATPPTKRGNNSPLITNKEYKQGQTLRCATPLTQLEYNRNIVLIHVHLYPTSTLPPPLPNKMLVHSCL